MTVRAILLVLLLGVGFAPQVDAVVDQGACCLQSGACEDLTLLECDGRGGASLLSRTCADSPCNQMAPILSPPAIVALAFVLLTLAVFTLMRRVTRS